MGDVQVRASTTAGHCHYDNGHFDIYYKGELAHDSGRYDDDWGLQVDERIRTSEFFNYYQRTIAHNTILVYDPDEKFEMGVLNDGGQKELLMVGGETQTSRLTTTQGVYPTKRRPGRKRLGEKPRTVGYGRDARVRGDTSFLRTRAGTRRSRTARTR